MSFDIYTGISIEFSCDVMLSSSMAAPIAMEVSICLHYYAVLHYNDSLTKLLDKHAPV